MASSPSSSSAEGEAEVITVLGVHTTVVDLGYDLSSESIQWPTDSQLFALCVRTHGSDAEGDFYSAGSFQCAEHCGTHIDAPYHFSALGATVDRLALRQLVCVCRVIRTPQRNLQVHDIEQHESAHGPLPEGCAVIVGAHPAHTSRCPFALQRNSSLAAWKVFRAHHDPSFPPCKCYVCTTSAHACYLHPELEGDWVTFQRFPRGLRTPAVMHGIRVDPPTSTTDTGWGHRYALGSLAYLGWSEASHGPFDTDKTELSFPGVSAEAAELLVSRRVGCVGIDTASLDPGSCRAFSAHRTLLSAGVYGIENLSPAVRLLPERGATLMAFPLKLRGGSGSPARVVAFLPGPFSSSAPLLSAALTAALPPADSVYALEVQPPFSRLLVSGAKTIETRRYPLPAALLRGQPVFILESQEGAEGVSALGDAVALGEGGGPRIVGSVVFSACKRYGSAAEWEGDRAVHCVPVESLVYNFSAQSDVFGWVVSSAAAAPTSPATSTAGGEESGQGRAWPSQSLVREHRSIFRFC